MADVSDEARMNSELRKDYAQGRGQRETSTSDLEINAAAGRLIELIHRRGDLASGASAIRSIRMAVKLALQPVG